MILLEVLNSNGAIDLGWVITILIGIIGTLVSTLLSMIFFKVSNIEKLWHNVSQEQTEQKVTIGEHEVKLENLDRRVTNLEPVPH